MVKEKWNLGKRVYYDWELTEFKLEDIINVMQKVADKFKYKVIIPKNHKESIIVEGGI